MKRRVGAGRGERGSGGRGAYIYDDYRHNHVISPGRAPALKRFIEQDYQGLRHKAANASSSNSEDALTWSCFDTLSHVSSQQRKAALISLWELAYGHANVPLGVLSGQIEIGRVFPPVGASSPKVESTEVDVSIEGEDALVFFEAKLYSPMSQAGSTRHHDQIAHKIRVGVREANRRSEETGRTVEFYFILLDIAPPSELRQQKPGVSLEKAREKTNGFGGKWVTAYWFDRYKYGRRGSLTALQSILDSGPDPVGARAAGVAANMGWLTWADVFKAVLRAVVEDRSKSV
jgi:hypothetical protein